MNDPAKRAILAGEYVLGTLPTGARARFERLMRSDPGLARLAGEWADRFAPIDEATPAVAPPERVWRVIAARTIASGAARAMSQPVARVATWRSPVALWRAAAIGAMAIAAALVVMIVTGLVGSNPPRVIAVLADKNGQPGWIVSAHGKSLMVEAVSPEAIATDQTFELWCMASGKPWALGVIPSERNRRVAIPSWEMPGNGVAFAVSIEPQGGSLSGRPTGPVVYQGAVLAD